MTRRYKIEKQLRPERSPSSSEKWSEWKIVGLLLCFRSYYLSRTGPEKRPVMNQKVLNDLCISDIQRDGDENPDLLVSSLPFLPSPSIFVEAYDWPCWVRFIAFTRRYNYGFAHSIARMRCITIAIISSFWRTWSSCHTSLSLVFPREFVGLSGGSGICSGHWTLLFCILEYDKPILYK
jgi:hypothetical protein